MVQIVTGSLVLHTILALLAFYILFTLSNPFPRYNPRPSYAAWPNPFRGRIFLSCVISAYLIGTMTFFLFLGMKLDGVVDWNFFTIFQPLWVNNYILFAASLFAFTDNRHVSASQKKTNE